MTETTKPIAETDHFIVLDKYEKIAQSGNYQSEKQLEEELLADLQQQGYEYRHDLNSHSKLLANLRGQLQRLNDVVFTDSECSVFWRNIWINPQMALSIRLAKSRITTFMISLLMMAV